MREWAGIDLENTKIDLNSTTALLALRKVLLGHYQQRYPYAAGGSSSSQVVLHVEMLYSSLHCKMGDSSSRFLAKLLKFLPEDLHLQQDTVENRLLHRVKNALRYYGYQGDNYKIATLDERHDVINALIPRICLQHDWRGTVEAIHQALIKKNSDIIMEHLVAIENLTNNKSKKIKSQDMPYMLSLQIIEYINLQFDLDLYFADVFTDLRDRVTQGLKQAWLSLNELPEIKPITRTFPGMFFSSCHRQSLTRVEPETGYQRLAKRLGGL